jgi:hypothetical protein
MTISAQLQQQKTTPSSVHRFAVWGLLFVLVTLFIWHAFIPAWKNLNSDFPNYYLAGLLFRHGVSLDRIYEWTWFQRQNDHLGVRQGLVGFAPNPPVCALPIVPLTVFPPLAAKQIWLLLNVAFLAAALWILKKVTLLSWPWLILIAFACIVPLHSNFLLGQYYVLLLLLISAGYFFSSVEKHFLSGALLGLAAALKLFPAPFLLFFLWKRNWGAVRGFICGGLLVVAASIAALGWAVHSVFLSEILPQVSRGDWLAPYDLWRNSFTTLWAHLFLNEPQLNPSPLINSVSVYIVSVSVSVTALLFGFVSSSSSEQQRSTNSLEWAAFVPLCLLLSTTTGSYHPTVLIFAALVAIDTLWRRKKKNLAIALFSSYVIAGIPMPTALSAHFPLRLIATVCFYALLLYELRRQSSVTISRHTYFAAAMVFLVCVGVNFRSMHNRAEDFDRRLSSSSSEIRESNPTPVAAGLAVVEMQQSKYEALITQGGDVRGLHVDGDVLSLAGSNQSDLLYLEAAGLQSSIFRLSLASMQYAGNPLLEGHDPALSADGKWLAFLRDERGLPAVWLTPTTVGESPRLVLSAAYRPLEIAVSPTGNVVAAVGLADSPHLVIVKQATGHIESMNISGTVRYPSISPDGSRVAFSRLEHGSWHLFVHDFISGAEQKLSHSACNATYPAWQNVHDIVYATDCGRGVGLTAIARVSVP